MSYKIKKGSVIVAIQQDGGAVAKTATKEKIYSDAEDSGLGWYVFKVKPGGLFSEFRVMEPDVIITPDITAAPDGTYTVVFDEFEDESQATWKNYVTIRLSTSKHEKNEDGTKNFFFGKQIVSYLSGPDNENNFQGFAHLDETGGIRIWKRFRDGENIRKYELALAELQKIGGEGRAEAGLAYALRSGRCMKCNRTLTVPASLHRGMGPICAARGEDA